MAGEGTPLNCVEPLLRSVEHDDALGIAAALVEGHHHIDAPINGVGSAIHVAASRGAVNACRTLLQHKASINLAEGSDGYTALHYACGEGHAEVVRMLLERGADPRISDCHGNTPEVWACSDEIRMIMEGAGRARPSGVEGVEGDGAGGGLIAKRSSAELHEIEKVAARDAARRRLGRRMEELVESEGQVIADIDRLCGLLRGLAEDPALRLKLHEQHASVDAVTVAMALCEVHVMLRGQLASCGQDAVSFAGVFGDFATRQPLGDWHSQFEAVASRTAVMLHDRAGGRVVGDRVVGAAGWGDPRLSGAVMGAQELLRGPTQRLMAYPLFLAEMERDAEGAGDERIAGALRAAAEGMRLTVAGVNERKRLRERRERVAMIEARLSEVPEGISIAKRDREFVLDQDNFIQRDQAGYRKLVLFNDCVLVCELPSTSTRNLLEALSPISPQPLRDLARRDLRFRDLIPLHGLTPASCPSVTEPAVRGGQRASGAFDGIVSNRDRSHSFEIRGRVFYGAKEVVETWVEAIRDVVSQLAAVRMDPRSSFHVPPDAVDYGLAPGSRIVSVREDDDFVVLYSF